MVPTTLGSTGRYAILFFCSLLVVPGCQLGVPATLAVDPNEPPGYRWLICPGGDPTGTVRGVIGTGGGTLEHRNGHRLTVPQGALTGNRTFTLQEPASPQLIVVAEVTGADTFLVPVSLTISYDRCTIDVDSTRLQIFRVNPRGDHDPLGGESDSPRTFRTDQLRRLSAYALATN
jgi:hypothetical protein